MRPKEERLPQKFRQQTNATLRQCSKWYKHSILYFEHSWLPVLFSCRIFNDYDRNWTNKYLDLNDKYRPTAASRERECIHGLLLYVPSTPILLNDVTNFVSHCASSCSDWYISSTINDYTLHVAHWKNTYISSTSMFVRLAKVNGAVLTDTRSWEYIWNFFTVEDIGMTVAVCTVDIFQIAYLRPYELVCQNTHSCLGKEFNFIYFTKHLLQGR